MRRIDLRVRRERAVPLSLPHLLFLLSGLYCLLLTLASVPALVFPRGMVCLCAGGMCLILWAASRRNWNVTLWLILLSAVLWAGTFSLLRDTVLRQSFYLTLLLMGKYTQTVPFTETAYLLGTLAALILFLLEFVLESHLIPYLLTSAAVLAGPALGIRPGMEAVILALLFQTAFWTVHETGLRQSRADLPLPDRGRLTTLAGSALAVLLALALLAAVPLASHDPDAVYAPVYQAENLIHSAVSRLTGNTSQPVSGGTISRGSCVRTGTVQLILTADRQPSEPVYLRGFSGGEYTSGEWLRAGDDAIFRKMGDLWRETIHDITGGDLREWETGEVIRRISGSFHTMYFNLGIRQSSAPETVGLLVREPGGLYQNLFQPYCGLRNADYEGEGWLFRFLEQKDLPFDWEELPDNINDFWYQWVQDTYLNEIQDAYTQAPEELLPRLSALCRENPADSPEQVSAFILHTLQTHAEYSLNPGWIPLNQEPVEYFLFESGRGYCQHFASAAALMYRLYGIPARYATGYVAWPEDFVPFTDAAAPDAGQVYLAALTDTSAHAWVELFLPECGWTPVEVTPAADGTIPVSWPGQDRAALDRFLADFRTSASTLPRRNASPASNTSDSLIISFLSALDPDIIIRYFSIFAGTALILLPAGLYLFRRHRLRRWNTASCRSVFARLLDMLRFSGVLSGCDGLEADFPERLAKAVPDLSADESRHLCGIVSAAAYGPETDTPESDAYSRQFYRRAERCLWNRLQWWKKPLFYYLYA